MKLITIDVLKINGVEETNYIEKRTINLDSIIEIRHDYNDVRVSYIDESVVYELTIDSLDSLMNVLESNNKLVESIM